MRRNCIAPLSLFVWVLTLFVCPSLLSADGVCTRGDLTKELSGDQAETLKMMGGDWWKNADICRVGQYRVAIPASERASSLFIWQESGPLLLIQEGFGLNLFGAGPSAVYSGVFLTLQDRSKDGIYDRLDYKSLDAAGACVSEVTDFDLDGQPDMKLLTSEQKAKIWFNDQWRDLHLSSGREQGVLDDGNFKRVQFKNGAWQFMD